MLEPNALIRPLWRTCPKNGQTALLPLTWNRLLAIASVDGLATLRLLEFSVPDPFLSTGPHRHEVGGTLRYEAVGRGSDDEHIPELVGLYLSAAG